MKFIIKILGIGFLIGGLLYFSNLFSRGGFTTNLITLFLRLINALAWIATGYGFLILKRWSLYSLGTMIALYIVTNLYNLYFTNIPQKQLNLIVPAFYIVLFLVLYTYRDKFLKK